MYKHSRVDFIETNLRPALVDSYDQQVEFIAESHEKFNKYRNRLAVAREEKEKKRLEILGNMCMLHVCL